MSKESMGSTICACGQRIQFAAYHWPHCPMNPANMSEDTHGAGSALLASLQAKFSKSELAQIATHGPVADKPVGKRRSSKGNTTASKRPRAGKAGKS